MGCPSSQVFHKCSTSVPQVFHKCSTSVPQVFHKCSTSVPGEHNLEVGKLKAEFQQEVGSVSCKTWSFGHPSVHIEFPGRSDIHNNRSLIRLFWVDLGHHSPRFTCHKIVGAIPVSPKTSKVTRKTAMPPTQRRDQILRAHQNRNLGADSQ